MRLRVPFGAAAPEYQAPLRLFLIVSISAIIVSCAPSGTWEGSIHERDGVTHVENPSDGTWAHPDRAPFSLVLEQVFGVEDSPEDAILATLLAGQSVAVDGAGNVYAIDRQATQIIAFAPDGAVRWRAGRRGEGPGEIDSNATGIVWDGRDRLYASLQNGARVDVWDLDGNYLDRQLLAPLDIGTASVVGFLGPTTLVLRDMALGRDGSTVLVLDVGDPWRVKAKFFVNGGFEDDPSRMHGASISVTTGGGRIRTGHRIEYLLREFDAEGTLTRVIRRDSPDLPATTRYGNTLFSFGEFKAPLQLPDGQLLAARWRMPNVESAEQFTADGESGKIDMGELLRRESAIDLLDPDGRYVGSMEVPGYFEETGKPMLVGPDGRLYTTTERPFPQVRRYRVEFEQ